ncbi:peptidylprolyl isomerase [Hahella aquimaris]|uniref:peptidylprolyl isomerase n=1 Tax=Hahella sp. HNIBRBA332 TaxID=3015983 RepID=UPI00273B6D20|nr:peptidylprolyl isomerase [Hahella sp. HNIBRBA332]WLQ13898.1 peptidylprolyl isomerase [Hahella sp. HNIBRBA332]
MKTLRLNFRSAILKALGALLLLQGCLVHAQVQELDRVVAVVNDDIVLYSELQDRASRIKDKLRQQKTSLPPESVLQEKVLEQLVLESIQMQMADRGGIRVSDSQLNQTMQNIAKQNGMTLDQFQQALSEEGVTYQNAREQIRREMIISRVQQRSVDSRVRVTEKEVNDFLKSASAKQQRAEEYHLAHILIALPENPSEAQRKEAESKVEKIRSQLDQGVDFKQLAITYSDASTATEGGDLGWRKPDQVPSLFADVAPKLAPGQTSEPIRNSSGVHFVAMLEKRGGASKVVEQSKVRHILVQQNELRDDIAAKKLIEEIYTRVQAGEDFAELAQAYSDDAVSAAAGGSLDWVSPGDMVPEFDQMMRETPVGAVSKPFQSTFGWHILQVQDRREADIGERLMASQARQVLHRRKYEEELQNWLNEIRDEAFVQLKL